jgi:oxygen-independent coproporphyrinogen-3 oxidase
MKIRDTLDCSHLAEFTVEAGRADSITSDKLKVMKECGITRISVNPQTMKQATLDFIGRRHTVEQVKEAFYAARTAGFDNINMDIILGLPGEDDRDVINTMEQIEAMSPDSLTAHSLAIKKSSALSKWIEKNGVPVLNNTDETIEIVRDSAAKMDMKPYYLYRQKHMTGNMENVGYARDGRYGIYNILIMEEKQTIIALGAGSITKRVYTDGSGRIERCENARDIATYISNIDEMIERKRKLFADDSMR